MDIVVFHIMHVFLVVIFHIKHAFLEESQVENNATTKLLEKSRFFNRLWKLHLPTKTKFLAWQLASNCLPTAESLHHHHVQVGQRYNNCENTEGKDTADHVFLYCDLARTQVDLHLH